MADRWSGTVGRAAVLLLTAAFVGVACSTAWARIAALWTVEPYGFAVHEQLLYNFTHGGGFTQTIHRGYDAGWTWSGHRAGTLPLVGLFYGLLPSPWWLAALQILAVAAGALPAAALGRAAFRHPAGGPAGALLYLGCPAVLGMALQDYQDLAFAVPATMLLLWALRRARIGWVAPAALLACLPREECVPVVAAAALCTFDRAWVRPWRRWLANFGLAGGVALVYGAALALIFPVGQGRYDVPLKSALGGLFDPAQIHRLFGLEFLTDFYALCWAPVGLVGVLAPLAALPGVALLLLHMTIPFGLGVDRNWAGHVHHLAPAVAFFVAAAILGLGRAWGWLGHPSLGRAGPWLRGALALGLLGYGAAWDWTWARSFNLVLSPWPRWPTAWHPAWGLVGALPPEAVPVVPADLALVASARPRSYTIAESLPDKAPTLGLGAATHLLVHRGDADILAWGLAMPDARVEAEGAPYLLLAWRPGAPDPTWARGVPAVRPTTWRMGAGALPPGVAPASEHREPVLPVKPQAPRP